MGLLTILLAAAMAAGVSGQESRRPPITSPDVLPDGRVVLRLWAPNAADVQLSGDWMGPTPPAPLAKDEKGTWTVTVGPLEPNIYTYGFLVNGVRTSDPACRCTLAWAGRLASSKFVLPGSAPNVWEERRGPKGTLHFETYFSTQQQRSRSFVVYTPPEYRESTARRYPVLVLLPGTPGDENDWTSGGGFAHQVFDNLLADRRMQPMIVAMHASDILGNGRRADNLRDFEPLLVNELVPEIKKRYRVHANPQQWAIAGLSPGGEFAVTVGLRHPELFRSVGSISGSLVERDFEDRFGKAIVKADNIRRQFRLIWVGCGSRDIFLSGNQAFAAKLKAAGIPHDFREFAGYHVMPVFRQQLVELLPRLFR